MGEGDRVASNDESHDNDAHQDRPAEPSPALDDTDTESAATERNRKAPAQMPAWAGAVLGGVLIALLVAIFINWNPVVGPDQGLPVLRGKAGRVIDEQAAEQSAARRAACDAVTKLLTYDYSRVDEFFDSVRLVTTGTFGRGFEADSATLRDLFVRGQVVSRSEGVECELVMSGAEKARVLVTATQISSSVESQNKEQTEKTALDVDLQKVDGVWLASDLSPASGSGPATAEPTPGADPTTGTPPPAEGPPPSEGQPLPEQAPAP